MSSEAVSETVDVGQILDGGRLRGLPLLVSMFTVLALVFDGFDIQTIAFVAPALMAEWGIDRSAVGAVLAAGLAGMAVGALALGPVGDRFGRRHALIASMALVAVSSLASAYVTGPVELALCRFATGVGLGGSLPNATALMSEFAPIAVRNLVVSTTVVGVPIGGMIGAEVSSYLLQAFGWRSVFVVGALLPGLLAFAMLLWMPESPRFLAQHEARRGELAALLNKLVGALRFRATDRFLIAERSDAHSRGSVRMLMSPFYLRDTLVIWLVFSTNVFAVYAFFGWLPTVLSGIGLPIGTALRGALFFNLGGVAGALLGALAMNRFGSRPTLTTLATVSVISTLALGFMPVTAGTLTQAASGVFALLAVTTVAGFCINAVQVAMFSVTAHTYPTRIRSSGLGWGLGVGRAGGILSSVAGSALLALGQGVRPFFVGVAAVLALTLVGVVLIRRHIPARIRLDTQVLG